MAHKMGFKFMNHSVIIPEKERHSYGPSIQARSMNQRWRVRLVFLIAWHIVKPRVLHSGWV